MRRSGPQAAAVAAIAIAAIDLALALTMLAWSFVPMRSGVESGEPALFIVFAVFLFFATTPVVGGLIALKRPENPIGWLFLATAFFFAFGFFTDTLARHLPPSPALGIVATVGSDIGGFAIATLFLVLLLFPTGSLPSRRWRILPWFIVISSAINFGTDLFAVDGGISTPIPGLPLPLARPDWKPVLDSIGAVAFMLFMVVLVGSVASLVVRFRRARGIERQQLKWFYWAASLIGLVLLFGFAVSPFAPAVGNAAWVSFLGLLVLLPIAAGIAILRYRLFDIDLIIRRTLVYAGLSAVLLAAYAASVLVLQQVLAPLASNNSLAVAASTLLVAALFSPARRRLQAAVDRRFYRQRYSAAREIARFGATLRDEVDVDRVSGLLAAAVDRTVQPRSASVWLREGER